MSDDDLDTRVSRLESDFKGLLSQHQSALQRISELEEELATEKEKRERAIFRIGKLEEVLPDETDEYETLSRDDKVSLVKSHLMERAYSTNGRAEIDYNGVQWSVFNGEPSADHCYTLMRLAAEESDGWTFHDQRRPKVLRVDLDATNGNTRFSHAKNSKEEGSL